MERFRNGHRCFVGVDQLTGKLANYRWITVAPEYIPEIGRYLVLKPDELYIYDLYTLPAFRKRGVDAYTRHYAYSYLKNSGFTKILAYVCGDNVPSLKASRLLLNEVGRVWYVKIRGFKPILRGNPNPALPELRNGRDCKSGVLPERAFVQVAKRR
jgi:ribosomal protein S18 acetylase RimI-like enzyme